MRFAVRCTEPRRYLGDLAEADDLARVRVHGEQHGGGLWRVALQQLQRLVQCLVEIMAVAVVREECQREERGKRRSPREVVGGEM